MFFVRRNIVGFHESVEKAGLTVVYTSDARPFLVRESAQDIAFMK